MIKSTMLGVSSPTGYDGTILLPEGEAIFPGTIFSYQPAHPQYGLKGGLPSNGAVAENAAWRQAAALLGLTDADKGLLDGSWVFGSDSADTRVKLEATSTGCIHGAVSHVNGTANSRKYLKLSDTLKTYILANTVLGGASATDVAQPWNQETAHRFALLMWVTFTKAGRTDAGKVGPTVAIGQMAGAGANAITISESVNTPVWPIIGVENTGFNTTSTVLVSNASYPALPNVVGDHVMRYAANRGWGAAKPAAIANFDVAFGWGPGLLQTASGFLQSGPSYTLHRADVIDLNRAVPYGSAKASRNIGGQDVTHNWADMYEPRNQLHAAKLRAFALGGQFYNDIPPALIA